ncbi:MAG: hypothetical protein GY757_54900, partial [bacterium]|nr:hypothetical protein [bacterium]
TVKGKTYNVLLDTGNAVGWMLHNRDLMKEFNALQGSMIKTRMGTQDGMLDGYTIYSKTADFGPFKMNGLIGVYVPKPHRDFYDANLNPAFIKNRVVTIDYVKKQMILRTKAAFDSDMASLDAGPAGVVQLPWYGYKHVYVPVQLKGNGTGSGHGLAMLETGAEDIALRLEFARKHGLQLTPAVKYLANGKVFHYFKSAVKLTLGTVPFQRKAADVWPLDRFHDQITGLGADVVMGPAAFANKNIISFDPIAKQVIIRK